MTDQTEEPKRLRVRITRKEIPTLRSVDPCPKCRQIITAPVLARGQQGQMLVGLVPDTLLQRGGEMRGTCSCGQEVVLYVPRIITALGK